MLFNELITAQEIGSLRLVRYRHTSTSYRIEKTQVFQTWVFSILGARSRDRTDDLRFTKPLLYQLSYSGNNFISNYHCVTLSFTSLESTFCILPHLEEKRKLNLFS